MFECSSLADNAVVLSHVTLPMPSIRIPSRIGYAFRHAYGMFVPVTAAAC